MRSAPHDDLPEAVRVVGMVHGLLFVVFCGALLRAMIVAKLSFVRAAVVFGGALSFGGGALWAPLFLCPTPSILLLPTATTHHNTLRYRNTTKRKTRGNTRKHGEAQGNTKKHRETQQPITNRLFTPTLPLPCINYLAPAQTSLMQRRLRPLSLEKALPMQPRTTRARGLIAVVRFPFLDHPGSCHQAYFSYNSYCYSKNNAICRSSRGASRRRRTGQAAAGGAPWQTFATNATRGSHSIFSRMVTRCR